MKEFFKGISSELLVPIGVAYCLIASTVQIVAYKKFGVW